MMPIPNFLVLGAQKAGTTSLYFYLSQHPDIYMSPVKEPHFFTFGDGNTNYTDPDFDPQRLVTTFDVYKALFEKVENEKAVGEASPSYLYNPRAPHQIKTYIPQAKMIAILRNPVERAFSNYMHCRRDGREPHAVFAEALEAEESRIQEGWSDLWHYKRQGFYFEQISRYLGLFDAAQLKIFLYEDLKTKPQSMLREIFGFLEVDDSFAPNVSSRHNVSGVPRNALALGVVKAVKPFNRLAKRFVPRSISSRVRELILERPAISMETRQQLEALYREDIMQLEELLGRDLKHWFQTSIA